MTPQEKIASIPHNPLDPDPWSALYLDRALPLNQEAKAALLSDMRSWSRQFLLPLLRPFTRGALILNQVLKVFIPNFLAAPKLLHHLIYWGLRTFATPEANFLILRHFHLGSEILQFLADNVEGAKVPTKPLKPRRLEDLKDNLFVQHDLNLFNFVINLNRGSGKKGSRLRTKGKLKFQAITDGPFPIEPLPRRMTSFVDVQTAIEIYTPLYQLFLTDNDFWRASNSLQLDESVACYVALLLKDPSLPAFVNNKHPLVPLSTLGAGLRLMLHGVSAETLHAKLVEAKRKAAGKK